MASSTRCQVRFTKSASVAAATRLRSDGSAHNASGALFALSPGWHCPFVQPSLSIEEGYGIPAFILNPDAWSAELQVGPDQTKCLGRGGHPLARVPNARAR